MSSPKNTFKPKPGQADYSHIHWAPVINCVVQYRRKILLVQRDQHLHFYPGYWNGISGFLDDQKSLNKKVQEELREELGIPKNRVRHIHLGPIFHQSAKHYNKTWIVHPILVDVSSSQVTIDWESRQYAWVTPQQARRLKLLPGFDQVLERLGPWLKK